MLNLEFWDRKALKYHIDEPLQGLRKDDAERNTDSGGSTHELPKRGQEFHYELGQRLFRLYCSK